MAKGTALSRTDSTEVMTGNLSRYAIIVAGGTGSRAGGLLPKQFQTVAGLPMLLWSVRTLQEAGARLVVAIHPDWIEHWLSICRSEGIVVAATSPGGATRALTVANALKCVAADAIRNGLDSRDVAVAVHDAARPLLSPALAARLFEGVEPGVGNVPAIPETDTVRQTDAVGRSCVVDRSRLHRVQTPQVFTLADMIAAYAEESLLEGATDDASVLERAGVRINLVEGEARNMKVTGPDDFAVAEVLMRRVME